VQIGLHADPLPPTIAVLISRSVEVDTLLQAAGALPYFTNSPPKVVEVVVVVVVVVVVTVMMIEGIQD